MVKKPQTTLDQLPIESRLAIFKYDAEDCKDAIHGRLLPKSFDHWVHQLCIVCGIRCHYCFAQELRGVTPEFTRALNARDIMSGIIPTISALDEAPYCILHPDVSSEDALRALVHRYPYMIYHAVHVAEQAGHASIQKTSKGSQEIYWHMLSHPAKFAVINDYKRTVDFGERSNHTFEWRYCSRSKYSASQSIRADKRPWISNWIYFNITEDFGIDDYDCEAPKTPDDDLALIYIPLPAELPLINKDSLIYVVAGDIDRHARLRTPEMLEDEIGIVIRGIYHNAFFAKYLVGYADSRTPTSGG
ncbi:hypothetical protein N7457_002488 [Penicillium paradoxum]|uniref:uncharacterized protein n=1 Tax=Penicillium paradoxum TaxID=176176 RepID=UPI002549BA3B|nr:uncharacterized protein N7457_002488 [Penicillium paradoxum]KAJ5787498.1 hypothetical protein N7457_002488 [Penicillium paradoxum]